MTFTKVFFRLKAVSFVKKCALHLVALNGIKPAFYGVNPIATVTYNHELE
ncbi:MAG: hypothetical protein ABR909_01570 [Candidatus Bathyarchaeia archaeon]